MEYLKKKNYFGGRGKNKKVNPLPKMDYLKKKICLGGRGLSAKKMKNPSFPNGTI